MRPHGTPHGNHVPYFGVLDSLRGVCALMVALFHLHANSHIENLALIRNSWLFVDFFFVLSGFVIAANYRTRLAEGQVSLHRFLWLRLMRLYPLHLFLLVLMIVTEFGLLLVAGQFEEVTREPFTGGRSLAMVPENLFLLQSLNISGMNSWNVPSWSISAEFWTYLVFGVAVVAGLIGRVVFVGLTLVAAPLMIFWFAGGSLALEADGGILRCLLGFGIGVGVWLLYDHMRPAAETLAVFEVPVFAIMLLFVIWAVPMGLTLLAPLIFGVVVLVFTGAGGVLSRFLSWRGLGVLGLLSYSLYMTHTYVHARCKNAALMWEKMTGAELFVDPANQVFGPTLWAGDLFVVVVLTATIAVSWLTWKYIEMPGQAWGRRQFVPVRAKGTA